MKSFHEIPKTFGECIAWANSRVKNKDTTAKVSRLYWELSNELSKGNHSQPFVASLLECYNALFCSLLGLLVSCEDDIRDTENNNTLPNAS